MSRSFADHSINNVAHTGYKPDFFKQSTSTLLSFNPSCRLIEPSVLIEKLNTERGNEFSGKNFRAFAKNRFSRIAHPEFKGISKDHKKNNAHSLASRMLSWAANSKISIFTTIGVLKATRFWMYMAVPSEDIRDKTDKAINELSGSLHLAKIFHFLSNVIALKIQESLIALDLQEGLNRFFKDEKRSIQTFFDVLLPKMYVNIAIYIKKNSMFQDDGEKQTASLVDVISLLIEILEAHLPDINKNYDRINNISDPKRRNQKLCKLFSPITDDFLAIALPNGVKDLSLTKVPFVSEAFWKGLKRNVLPTLCIKAYQDLALPLKEIDKDELKHEFGGESLACIAETAGIKAADSIALLFAGALDEYEKKISSDTYNKSFITDLISSFTSLISGSGQLKAWSAKWFAEQLSTLGKSTDVYIKSIWKLLDLYVEVLLLHVFKSLLKSPHEQAHSQTNRKTVLNERSKDVLGSIFYRLFSVTNLFLVQNRKAIEDRISHLNGEQSIEEDPELNSLFTSYANEFLKVMGLYHLEDVPLPPFLLNNFIDALREMASKFLLKQYFVMASLSGIRI